MWVDESVHKRMNESKDFCNRVHGWLIVCLIGWIGDWICA